MVREEARDDSVGGDHQVLDQFRRAVHLLLGEVAQRILLEDGPRFDRLQRQRAHLMPLLLQRLRRQVLLAQVRLESVDVRDLRRHRALSFEPRADAWIRQLGAIAHDRFVHVRCTQRPVLVDDVLDDDRVAILVLVQRRQVGGEALGQHRKNLRAGVNRGGVVRGVLIHRRVARDERVHVGDGDKHLRLAVGRGLGDRQLIEVARVVIVDGAPQQLPQVQDIGRWALGFGLWALLFEGRDLFQRRGGKVGLEAAVAHRLVSNLLEKCTGRGHRDTVVHASWFSVLSSCSGSVRGSGSRTEKREPRSANGRVRACPLR